MADVTTTFGAKDVGFNSTVNQMQKTLAGFQSNLGGFVGKLAGFAAAFISVQQTITAFSNALDMGARLDDLSKTTGASAGELLVLEKAFTLAGSSAEAVGPAIARLNRFMVEASNGGALQVETMNRLGLSYAQLANLTPTEQMRLLAEGIMSLQTPAERSAAAMDIFGRSGSTLIPLFANFSGELNRAQGYLGSLPELMDQSAGAMADMQDATEAVSDKFNQFVAGLVAGSAGANNFVEALAKIDTAGIGANLGQQLRAAFDAPLESAKAIGYTLMTGVAEVGNRLMNALATAGQFFLNLLSDGDYWKAIGGRLKAGLMEAVNAFNKLLLTGIEMAILEPLSNLPGIVGEPFRVALGTVRNIRAELEATSARNYSDWNAAGKSLADSVDRAAQKTAFVERDWFNVKGWAESAANSMQKAQEASAEIEQRFIKGSAALTNALNEIRGFDLSPKAGSNARPDWFKSNTPPPSGGGERGGGGGGSRGGGSSGKSSDRPPTRNERIATMRGDYRARAADERAAELESRGMFASADAARRRGDRRRESAMQKARLKDLYETEYGGAGNFGEAYQNYRDQTPMGRLTEDQLDRFNKGMLDMASSPEERKKMEEEMRGKHAPKGGKSDMEKDINDILDAIKKHLPQIDEKLPQHALA